MIFQRRYGHRAMRRGHGRNHETRASRVENGHTVPSLETLQKIAGALDLQLSQFFAENSVSKEVSPLNLNEEEIRFLTQVQRYSANLSDSDRRLLLAMVRKFASTALS